MIDREKNGMARLLQELKKGIRSEIESRRGADTNSEDNEKSKDDDDDESCTTYQVRIPLVPRCPGTVFTLVSLQVYSALDESSRTVFALSCNDL